MTLPNHENELTFLGPIHSDQRASPQHLTGVFLQSEPVQRNQRPPFDVGISVRVGGAANKAMKKVPEPEATSRSIVRAPVTRYASDRCIFRPTGTFYSWRPLKQPQSTHLRDGEEPGLPHLWIPKGPRGLSR